MIMLLFYLFVFIFGLAIGSFLNVVIYRMENGEDIVRDRSHCMSCKHILAWYDLVPVFSFFALRGKCRYCGKPLSWQYPLVEIITALLFLQISNFQFPIFNEFSITNFQFSSLAFNFDFFFFLFSFFYWFFIISSLIVIFVYDLKHYIIPDKVVYLAIGISLIYILFGFFSASWRIENLITLFNPFIAAFLASGFFLAIVLITKGVGMGGGDVKLAFLMGLVLSWPKILLALFLAFTLGAICGIILMFLKKKSFKSEIPFGPFLVIGTLIAMFWGQKVIEWYSFYLF